MMEMDRIIQGNCLEILPQMPDESIDCCITSPPYWGLRDYKTEPQVWGGRVDCEHEWIKQPPRRKRHPEDIKNHESKQATEKASSPELPYTDSCVRCNAWRGSLGLEPTPELYVKHLVEVFREVKRVLRSDGTLWLNLGDSYASSTNGGSKVQGNPEFNINRPSRELTVLPPRDMPDGLKPKDLVGIPWSVAFALRADGWVLRSEIIWHKPNPMPESVRDRPTKSHEQVFLFAKSQKYYYDADAIRENKNERGFRKGSNVEFRAGKEELRNDKLEFIKDKEWFGRNKRSVWTISTKPFHDAHFATFPPELVEPMVKAGCPERGVVLDPFFGSGTVGLVAKKQCRHFIGIDLNPDYCRMAEKRLEPYLNQKVLA